MPEWQVRKRAAASVPCIPPVCQQEAFSQSKLPFVAPGLARELQKSRLNTDCADLCWCHKVVKQKNWWHQKDLRR